jgi:[glutamine synthetase] adenylyltransferase / [glutamine synthetase]-adenylyl-L-tyrosine phosphorylase
MEASAILKNAIESLPPELRLPVTLWFERLADSHDANPDDGVIPELVRLVACSEFGGNTLLRYWPDLDGRLGDFDEPVEIESLEHFATSISQSDAPDDEIKAALRSERNRRLLHILWRELAGSASVAETLAALSDTADQLLRAAAGYAERQIQQRFGVVRDVTGEPVTFVILGMGKLGGRELNFSSDIDIIFCYSADGESDGRKNLHAQEYFGRLSRQIVTLIDESTADGFVFRTDTRLRPFGESGPPVVSFAALETYLLQHGRDWERYAYVKANIVGPKPPAIVSEELFSNLISPFVYRRYLDYGVFESLREMHAMIAAEVRRRELADNIKLGPGGIREIEFIAQSFQLVRGGRSPELQNPSLLAVLLLLVDGRGISEDTATKLADAYEFLRRLENFIQAIRDKQTHDLPVDAADRARLCLAMGLDNWEQLKGTLDMHRRFVSRQFDEIAFRGEYREEDDSIRSRLAELWEAGANADKWQKALENDGFDDAEALAPHIVAFQSAPANRNVDAIAADRLQQFMPRLLILANVTPRPAIAVERSLTVIEKILRRSAYLALLNENRVAAERLVGLCERSAYIAGEIARFPALLDELLDPRLLSGPISKDDVRLELKERLPDNDAQDSEERMEALAQFQRAVMFRVAVADFNGNLPIMKVSDSLTFLAEAVLEEALASAWRDLVDKHGPPTCVVDGEAHTAGFGIIAYGKLGGLELSYGSDLDIVFLHDSKGDSQTTRGPKPLDNAIFFQRLVRRLVHFLTTQTNSGVLYDIDTRLRPSGRKGLLVTSTEAFERYQDENAWTWEHQALLRARHVAGSEAVGREFERIRKDTLGHRVRLDTLRNDVVEMRARMRKELDRSDKTHFDLKQGSGGIGDIEFLVQYLVLRYADEHEPLIEFSDNIRQLDALVACGDVDAGDAATLQESYRQYRLRQHHLALNDEPPLVSAELFAEEREHVERTWEKYFES